MSDAMRCDQCGSVLVLDHRGEDPLGEKSGWLSLKMYGRPRESLDLCSRACLVAMVESEGFIAFHDEVGGV